MAMKADVTYSDAIRSIETEAAARAPNFQDDMETIPLVKAVGRVSGCTYTSPESTPHFDTSAMDGYALNSEVTRNASVESPAIFCVKGLIAAGDEPMSISTEPNSRGEYPCVEIMTGARFPSGTDGKPFDCCVRIEDVMTAVEGRSHSTPLRIKVTQPARYQQNRRLAGGDFAEGDLIIRKGSTLQTNHIMALASVGYTDISVYRKPRVAIYSTGLELTANNPNDIYRHKIRDVNGPFCSSMLESWGVEVDFLGVIGDDAAEVSRRIKPHVDHQGKYDLIITTGAVSVGRFDLVRAGIEFLGASIIFHGVSMRPGHPALFAAIPGLYGDSLGVPFFGLPGNPVASAACLRFLVLPYLWRLQSQKPESPLNATFAGTDKLDKPRKNVDTAQEKVSVPFPPDKDVFRPGILRESLQQKLEVRLITDHSPGKVKPFLGANCWIHIGRNEVELREGGMVEVFPID